MLIKHFEETFVKCSRNEYVLLKIICEKFPFFICDSLNYWYFDILTKEKFFTLIKKKKLLKNIILRFFV